jgi:hypothetical protein
MVQSQVLRRRYGEEVESRKLLVRSFINPLTSIALWFALSSEQIGIHLPASAARYKFESCALFVLHATRRSPSGLSLPADLDIVG